ncbi:hypothetical protein RchiOBHm_Chr4g0392531 [Rosa chinensis]|uniref:Uncharacterized protein n=1 Tax=Rosa chinensis TaxID=74649 RepID=A0A2P6QQS2_ROSCH|nr:hypothetical protein RchiOBHm_Chr4g0392531 [Rosa chinensis]
MPVILGMILHADSYLIFWVWDTLTSHRRVAALNPLLKGCFC